MAGYLIFEPSRLRLHKVCILIELSFKQGRFAVNGEGAVVSGSEEMQANRGLFVKDIEAMPNDLLF